MKQNIIQSIIRRGLSFVFLSLLMPLGVGAQTNYNLWIGDTQVTSDNAGNVLGDGKVSFTVSGGQEAAPTYTLTLNGAELTAPVKVGLSNLTFDIQGTNSITTSEACIQKMDNTSPSLTFKSTANDVGSLILTSNNGPISEIGQGNISISKELAVLLTVNGEEDSTSNLYYITDGYTTVAKIVPSYGVSIDKIGSGKVDIYAGNAADVFGDRTVSFDKTTNTLTLNGADRGAISTSLAELTIELIGPNTLSEQGSYPVLRSLYGDDVTIIIQSTDGSGGLTMNMPYTQAGNFCDDNVNLEISDPLSVLSGSLTGNDGNENTVGIGLTFNLWVAGTQVTTANASNIKGDGVVEGKVTFDGVNTLILTYANLSGPIETSLANLIVEIDRECSLSVDQYAFIAKESTCKITFATKDPKNSSITVSDVQSAPFSGFAEGNIIYLNELVGSLSESGAGYQIAVPNASYGFSVDDVEVTKKNRLTIGDGIQFDGKNTLILANAEISGIYISNNQNLKNGLNIYLIGENTIRNSSNAVYGTAIPLSIATSSENPGSLAYICQACSLATANQAFNGYTVEYKNDLIATLDYTDTQIAENNEGKTYEDPTYIKQQTVTIAATLVPVVDHTGEVANLDGDPNGSGHGEGLGKELEGHQGDAQVITADKKMLMTLGEKDGFFDYTSSTTGEGADLWDGGENAKLVLLSTEQNEIPANVEPGTLAFQTACKAVTMAVPAGRFEVSCEYKNLGNGQLTLQVGQGTDAQRHVFDQKAAPGKASIVFATQRPRHIFLYNSAPSPSSRFRAPGRKMANTTTLKSVKVSARSVAATPPPVLMPKVLTKDDVAAAKSDNHITITDDNVVGFEDDAFEDYKTAGITYVDLSSTSISSLTVDRSKLPENAIILLPAGNDAGTAKNVVIGGVCEDLELSDARTFEIPSDFTAVKVAQTRTYTAGQNSTVCLPYALDATQAAALGTFYEPTAMSMSEHKVTMTSVEKTDANTPYMFKPKTGVTKVSAEMVDVKKPAGAQVPGSNGFIGTFTAMSINSGTKQYYCFSDTGIFWHVTSAVNVLPFRAYFELGAALGRSLDIDYGDGTTGISNVQSSKFNDQSYYDLQGRRVLYPKKGLYILNGKKVIIK